MQIPTHSIQEIATSGIILKQVRDGDVAPNGELALHVGEAHRDNYYVFFFLESGDVRLLIDFKEHHIRAGTLGCVFPGQVHHLGMASHRVSGWAMCLDTLFIKDEWKAIFEKVSVSKNPLLVPDNETRNDLQGCFELLNRKMQSDLPDPPLVYALATALAGLMAELFRQQQATVFNKRLMSITLTFKTLVDVHLKTEKSPTQYASLLHLSPTYLNEAVKTITGFSAGYWILHAVVLEAKRQLFYTDKHIKEIARELGYEDAAYFTRVFSRLSGMSPTLFRTNYRK
jgi:AraC-like DNA-binding protein